MIASDPKLDFKRHAELNETFFGNDYFLEPYLFPREKTMLYKYMDKSHTYFEFGSGGSTHQAAKRKLKIFTVEVGPAWKYQLEKEFKEIKEKHSNNSGELMNFDIDITYLIIDLQSQAKEDKKDRLKYCRIYNHSKYKADLIYINGKFKFACVMNVYKEIYNNTFIFIHELNKKFDYSNLTKYFDIIEQVNRSVVVRKKYPAPPITKEILEYYENQDFKIKQKSVKRIASLRRDFNEIIEKYRYDDNSNMTKPNFKQIWLFWWTGMETAPPIIKMCYSSIQKNFNGNITIITKYNYLNFAYIPSYIVEKYNASIIKTPAFTDIYRMSLLASNGGLWLDATIFANKEISLDWFNYPYYSIHFDDDFDLVFGKWCGFCQSAYINCIINRFCAEMFFAYWKKFDHLIHYFLVDYIMIIGYDYIPSFRRLVQNVPLNNEGVHQLYNHINEEYSEDLFNSIWKSSGFFKLTWKKEIKSKINGKKTIFGHLEDKINFHVNK